MTNIGFYIIKQDKPEAANLLACRLAEKAYMNKLSLYIHTQSEYQCNKLDELLWTFRQGNFIPHVKDMAEDDVSPIRIGFSAPKKDADFLINLSNEVPNFFSRFTKMAEVVEINEKKQGRARYKFYQDRGYPLKVHEV